MPIMFGFTRQREQLLTAELRRFVVEALPFGALRAYLVGEFGDGRIGPETELELVIVQETSEPPCRRADFWATHLRPKVGMRFLVYTPEEFDALADADPVLREAIRLDKVVVG